MVILQQHVTCKYYCLGNSIFAKIYSVQQKVLPKELNYLKYRSLLTFDKSGVNFDIFRRAPGQACICNRDLGKNVNICYKEKGKRRNRTSRWQVAGLSGYETQSAVNNVCIFGFNHQ
jgi:hypothetical protein